MASKIKVDNIENQCGGAVVTKCGATTTIAGTNVNATTVTATNVVGSTAVKSDNIQAADGGNIINQCGTTITLGASGDTINLASGASQTGFGRTGTVDWDTTPKTASFNATSGDGFFCNTTSSAFTATLPSGAAGAIVSFADYAGTWQTNTLTVSPQSGEKIGGAASNVVLNTEGQSVTFVYVDSTQGWVNVQDSTSNERGNPYIVATGGTITTSGNCKIHTFTGPGTFTVQSAAACSADNVVSYVVVAGGGGGANGVGAGGGAGGFREVVSPSSPYTGSPLNGYPNSPNRITVTATAFPITVGGGGSGGGGNGVSGNNSIFSTITSTGGGGGSRDTPGGDGGSGGGAYIPSSPQYLKGSGNTPPVSPPQGNPGGEGNSAGGESGGGGGGAGAPGNNGTNNPSNPNDGGPGGVGVSSQITTSSVTRAGGGGGSGFNGTGGAGGSGGGGDSGPGRALGPGIAGTANTGGGGGAGNYPGSPNNGAAGGSGIVVIRYKFQ